MDTLTSGSTLLRKSLRWNGYFSSLSALTCLTLAPNVATWLGLTSAANDDIVSQGVSLALFAAFLFLTASEWAAGRRRYLFIAGSVAVVLDLLWVLGSAGVLVYDLLPLSTIGKWVIGVVALFVFDFALFQFLGLRRLKSKSG